ncbi:MAG: TRAP transporter small permease [Bacteroidota bacterium]
MKTKIDNILEKILVSLMVILVLDVLWQVISRYVNKFMAAIEMQIPTKLYAFTDELAGFLLVWVALLGGAYATGKKQHLAIELLATKLSDKNNKKLNLLINFMIFVFSVGALIIGGGWLVYTRFYLGQVSAAMELPIGIVYLVLPISGMIISYYVIEEFVSLVKSLKAA